MEAVGPSWDLEFRAVSCLGQDLGLGTSSLGFRSLGLGIKSLGVGGLKT